VAGADLREHPDPLPRGLRAVGLEQDLPEVLVDRDRRIGGGVHAPGDRGVDLADRDLVGNQGDRLEPGAAGLLDVVGRRLGGELRAQHHFADQIEVAAVLQHGAGGNLAEPLAFEAEARHEPVDRCREHVLVRGGGVSAVRAGERDAVGADDRHPPGRLVHA
jgi:hypothetical protein